MLPTKTGSLAKLPRIKILTIIPGCEHNLNTFTVNPMMDPSSALKYECPLKFHSPETYISCEEQSLREEIETHAMVS